MIVSRLHLQCFLLYFILVFSLGSSLGNYLEQFQRYLEGSSFNASSFYADIQECELMKKPIWLCAKQTYERVIKENTLMNKGFPWKRQDSRNPNCFYEIQQIMTTPQEPFIHLRVRQSNCSRPTFAGKTSFLGGSSFHILSEGLYQLSCNYYDRFNNFYDVICHLHPSFLPPSEKVFKQDLLTDPAACTLITMILDFEHYDAYNEFTASFQSPAKPLEYFLLDRQPFCMLRSISELNPLRNASFPSPNSRSDHHNVLPASSENEMVSVAALLRASQQLNYDDDIIVNGVWKLKTSPKSISHLFSLASDPHNYDWKWQLDLLPPSPTNEALQSKLSRSFKQCIGFSGQRFSEYSNYYYFGGESHLRYGWDYFVESLDPSFISTLGVKHNSSQYGNLQSLTRTFMTQLNDFISFTCQRINNEHAKGSNTTLILQTGTWDITYWPLRAILENPRSSGLLLQTLQQVLSKNNGKSCYDRIPQLVWLDTVLYPYCKQRDRSDETPEHQSACTKNRMGRNNYAILALNQYMEKKLQEMIQTIQLNDTSSLSLVVSKMDVSKLRVIPTRNIFLPRLLVVKYVCKNHYLCRELNEEGKTVVKSSSSKEGIIAVEAIKRAICAGNK